FQPEKETVIANEEGRRVWQSSWTRYFLSPSGTKYRHLGDCRVRPPSSLAMTFLYLRKSVPDTPGSGVLAREVASYPPQIKPIVGVQGWMQLSSCKTRCALTTSGAL